MLLTVAELPSYLRVADKWLAEDERANLSAAERNALGRLADELVSIWMTR